MGKMRVQGTAKGVKGTGSGQGGKMGKRTIKKSDGVAMKPKGKSTFAQRMEAKDGPV